MDSGTHQHFSTSQPGLSFDQPFHYKGKLHEVLPGALTGLIHCLGWFSYAFLDYMIKNVPTLSKSFLSAESVNLRKIKESTGSFTQI